MAAYKQHRRRVASISKCRLLVLLVFGLATSAQAQNQPQAQAAGPNQGAAANAPAAASGVVADEVIGEDSPFTEALHPQARTPDFWIKPGKDSRPPPPDQGKPGDKTPSVSRRLWWPWALAGAGVVALAVGLGVGLTRPAPPKEILLQDVP